MVKPKLRVALELEGGDGKIEGVEGKIEGGNGNIESGERIRGW